MRNHYFVFSGLLLFFISFTIADAATAVPPELPREFINTTYNAAESGTCNVTVSSGGDVQAALDAIPNQNSPYVVCLQAGGTFKRFDLKNKSGNAWITIRTSTPDSQFVQPGKRVSPADASKMAKVQSGFDMDGHAAIWVRPGAHNYRVIGIELVMAPKDQIANCAAPCTGYNAYNLFQMGSEEKTYEELPKDIIADRMYIHGEPGRNVFRGVAANGVRNSVIDSYISEIHTEWYDSQAVNGINGPGPFKISNNYLEAAGENIMFGGSGTSYLNGGNIPSDIEITNNYIFKPLSWRKSDPKHSSWAGYSYVVKNLLEIKTGIRVLIEGNVLENSWPQHQNGLGLNIALVDEHNKASEHITDLTIRKNHFKNMPGAITMGGAFRGIVIKRVSVENNLFTEMTGEYYPFTFTFQHGIQNLSYNHNTALNSKGATGIFDGNVPMINFEFKNNLVGFGGGGLFGQNIGWGYPSFRYYSDPDEDVDSRITSNVFTLANHNPAETYYTPAFWVANHPPKNYFPTSWAEVAFENYAGNDFRLSANSPYKNKGTDGKDIGADIPAVLAATANTVSGGGSTYTPPASSPTSTPTPPPPPTSPATIPQNSTTVFASPLTVDFGSVALGTESPNQRISLFNNSSIKIPSVSFSTNGDYSVKLNYCNVGVAPNTHCDVYVSFKPSMSGSRPGSIIFSETGVAGSPQTVSLKGTGVQTNSTLPIVTLPAPTPIPTFIPTDDKDVQIESLKQQIKDLTALVAQLTTALAQKTGVRTLISAPSGSTLSFNTNLYLAMTHSDVLRLQQFLNKNGFPVATSGPGSNRYETTTFGVSTYKALVKFQASVGIEPTGYFGPETRAYINKLPR